MKSLILILASTAILASGAASAATDDVAAGSRKAARSFTYGKVTTQVLVASFGTGIIVASVILASKTRGTNATTGTTGTH